MGCVRGAPLGLVNINNPESLILRSHPAQSCASSFRNGQIRLIDFLFFFPPPDVCIPQSLPFIENPYFSRSSDIVSSQVPILSHFPDSMAPWSRGSPIVSLVPANWSPSPLGFQPLPWDPANLSSALLSPHPCQFWLISQTKRALIAAAGFPWSACQAERNRDGQGGGGRGIQSFLSFAA